MGRYVRCVGAMLAYGDDVARLGQCVMKLMS
jgi:hypothetical protein